MMQTEYEYDYDVSVRVSKFTGKERDFETCSTSCLDYFGARHYASSLGRFMSLDPKMASGKPSDPETWNRYAYTGNNPLRYIDPGGKDWETAWNDLKSFAGSLYTRVTVGAGLYGKGTFGAGEVKIGVAYKNTVQFTSKDVSLTQSVEASASAGTPGGPRIGGSIGAQQLVRSVNSDGTVTQSQPWQKTTGESVADGDVAVKGSGDRRGIGVQEGVLLLGGIEFGSTTQGLNALSDALRNVKDEIVLPMPPPPSPPRPPETPPPPPLEQEQKEEKP